MRLYELYIFDLDGTLFRGNEPLPGAVETVAELRKRKARIRFLTNNSSQTRQAYVEKLGSMGFKLEDTEVYSSAIGTAAYCKEAGLAKLFVVGESGLVKTLREAELEVINADPSGSVGPATDYEQAEAVVAGIHRLFTYTMMSAAMQHVLQGARLIATNTDATYPLEEDRLIPGAGAIVSSLETCTGQEAFVVGKPNPFLIELVMRDGGISAKDTLVVGDRYETDIESGIRAGCDTHLVLTGVTKEAPGGQNSSPDLRGLLA
ncbi:MAG: hypothetical protein QOJ65_2682 [Fimbriimonadaceae bacterium]|nr:hypothetical protein [Fimbriimonadaceae bacterium]